MKLIIKCESGLILLRPSRVSRKVAVTEHGLAWVECRMSGPAGQVYPQEVQVAAGAHEVERIDNPFVPGGEPWLVLKGSRIGAAEAYLKGLAAATHGTSNGVELAAGQKAQIVISLFPQAEAA